MKKRFWFVALPVAALVFLIVVMTGALVTFILPKYYLSEAQIKIARTAGRPSFLQLEFEVIKCDKVLLPVIEKLNLGKEWGNRLANGQSLDEPLCLSLLRNRLDLRTVKNMDIIRIGVISDRPLEAAELANAVASAYANYCTTNGGGVRVAILNQAEAPVRPVTPKIAHNILLSAIIGALLGAGVGAGCGWLVCRASRRTGVASATPP